MIKKLYKINNYLKYFNLKFEKNITPKKTKSNLK